VGGLFARNWAEKRAITVLPDAFKNLSAQASSGVTVTNDKALEYSAVYACIRNLAEDLAKMPLKVFRKRDGGGQDEARNHPLYRVLHDQPNAEMSSFSFRETLMGHNGGWGNSYAQIIFSPRDGSVESLWPLRVDWMTPKRDPQTKELFYHYRPRNGEPERLFPASYILHVPSFGFDGLQGYDPIRLQRESIGLGKAAEEYGGRFFKNDARPGYVVKTAGKLSETAYTRLKKNIEERGGLINAHRPQILEEGLELQTIGIHPEAAQYLETKTFQIAEIARWYRMPPHKIQDLTRATNNNIEHQGIEYVMDTMLAWVVRWEQVYNMKLLTPQERRAGYFVGLVIEGLMRGDIAARGQYYATGRQWGWLCADDIRDYEGMNPLPDGQGKIFLIPMNMIPASQAGDYGQTGGGQRSGPVIDAEFLPDDFFTPEEKEFINERPTGIGRSKTEARADWEKAGRQAARYRRRLTVAQIPILEDIAGRTLRRERNDITTKAGKMLPDRPVAEFDSWLEDFYRDHAGFIASQFEPALAGFAELVRGAVADEGYPLEDVDERIAQFVRAYANGLGIRITGEHLFRLRQKIENGLAAELDLVEMITETLDDWTENQAAVIARREATRANNGTAFTLYTLAGVIYLRSVAFGKSCPFCTSLDGRVIGIQEYFLHAGESFQPEGAEKPLTSNNNKKHAPYHDGCDCAVIAG